MWFWLKRLLGFGPRYIEQNYKLEPAPMRESGQGEPIIFTYTLPEGADHGFVVMTCGSGSGFGGGTGESTVIGAWDPAVDSRMKILAPELKPIAEHTFKFDKKKRGKH